VCGSAAGRQESGRAVGSADGSTYLAERLVLASLDVAAASLGARRQGTTGPTWWRPRSRARHDGADLVAAAR
jgi:hypothetical protein